MALNAEFRNRKVGEFSCTEELFSTERDEVVGGYNITFTPPNVVKIEATCGSLSKERTISVNAMFEVIGIARNMTKRLYEDVRKRSDSRASASEVDELISEDNSIDVISVSDSDTTDINGIISEDINSSEELDESSEDDSSEEDSEDELDASDLTFANLL